MSQDCHRIFILCRRIIAPTGGAVLAFCYYSSYNVPEEALHAKDSRATRGQ